ncbi:MAG: hypothetical protein AAFQ65_04090 [Myxococcota bacterium]
MASRLRATAKPTPKFQSRCLLPASSFFEELVVGSGTVSVDDISGFSVSDGTLALAVRVVESEVGGNLIFSALIFADLARDAFDLIDFGGTYERFELYRTP